MFTLMCGLNIYDHQTMKIMTKGIKYVIKYVIYLLEM